MSGVAGKAVALAALVASAALAGCFGGGEEGPAPTPAAVNDTGNRTLPDGRQAIAFQETNYTANGTVGMEHTHDAWQGRDQVVVFQADVIFSASPPMPEGEGKPPTSVAFVRLPRGSLVYEGTSQVTVEAANPRVRVLSGTPPVEAPDPSPPSFRLFYHSAADAGFVEAGALPLGGSVTIPVEPKMTDMPHSTTSLWAFRIAADRKTIDAINLTVTIVRGADPVEWPGHPNFYADKDVRVVLDTTAKTAWRGYVGNALYGQPTEWIHPERLISYGTGTVEVFVNVTSVRTGANAKPVAFWLNYHNATQLDEDPAATFAVQDPQGQAYVDPSYHFVINVHPDGMDSPYQPASRWGFRLAGQVSDGGQVTSLDDWEVEYTITVLAHKYVPPVRPE